MFPTRFIGLVKYFCMIPKCIKPNNVNHFMAYQMGEIQGSHLRETLRVCPEHKNEWWSRTACLTYTCIKIKIFPVIVSWALSQPIKIWMYHLKHGFDFWIHIRCWSKNILFTMQESLMFDWRIRFDDGCLLFHPLLFSFSLFRNCLVFFHTRQLFIFMLPNPIKV